MKYVLNTLAAIMAFGMLTVAMPDIAFAGSAKVDVCHIPPGNPENFHTIRISEKAYSAHLAHGDFAGACDDACAALCDDGNACTIDDTADCEQNGCPVTPEAVDCNDGNECTADSCSAATGCVNTPRLGEPCDDGVLCTGDETCNAQGACQGPAIDNCCLFDSDCSGDLCDQASCNLDTNRCGNDPVVCNPSDLCQVSVCSNNDGQCTETETICDEGETCDPGTGDCVAISYQCDLTGTTASATSVFSASHSADHAIDGNKTSGLGWIPADNAGYPQTLSLDFGTLRGISGVAVTQVTSGASFYKTKDYVVDVSPDNVNWTNVINDELPVGNASQQTHAFALIQAQYVRLVVMTGWDTAAFNRGGGILEIEFNCQ